MTRSFHSLLWSQLPLFAAAASLYLNGDTGVTVEIGDASNPIGDFMNLPRQQSLTNAISFDSADHSEVHTSSNHVWWSPGPLELIFDLGGTYELNEMHFWNYFTEGFDVDQLDVSFYDSENGAMIDAMQVFPRLGENSEGLNTNQIVAETFTLEETVTARRVSVIFSSTSGQLNFDNIGFTADIIEPTLAPIIPTLAPVTPFPTAAPITPFPTLAPITPFPTLAPITPFPTLAPITPFPTLAPSVIASELPSGNPSILPSGAPSILPTGAPSILPSGYPSILPSGHPSILPSGHPSGSSSPSWLPTESDSPSSFEEAEAGPLFGLGGAPTSPSGVMNRATVAPILPQSNPYPTVPPSTTSPTTPYPTPYPTQLITRRPHTSSSSSSMKGKKKQKKEKHKSEKADMKSSQKLKKGKKSSDSKSSRKGARSRS